MSRRHEKMPHWREHADGKQAYEKISTPLAIRKMQIKSTVGVSLHTSQNGQNKKKNSDNTKTGKKAEKLDDVYNAVQMENAMVPLVNRWPASYTTICATTGNPSNCILGHVSRGNANQVHTGTCKRMFTAALPVIDTTPNSAQISFNW